MANAEQSVYVQLEVITRGESHPVRHLKLQPPSYSIRIGRGSRSGSKDLYPDRHNAWFESRVMSRDHAVLKACPDTKQICIEDVGSMHGTIVDGNKLTPNRGRSLTNGQPVLFGAEVSRGSDVFPALEIDVFYEWHDNVTALPHPPRAPASFISRNTFSLPDYDSEEDDDYVEEVLDEVNHIKEVEVVLPSKKAIVPESDFSNIESFTSDDDPYEVLDATNAKKYHHTQADANKDFPSSVTLDTTFTPAVCSGKLSRDDSGKEPVPLEYPEASTKSPTTSKVHSTADYAYITDSESDYGDDISADDFAEHLGSEESCDKENPYQSSSLSSQSPSTTSMPNVTTKPDVASTNQAGTGSQTDAVRNSFSGAPAIMKSLSGPAVDALRAPSPSDAAMAKSFVSASQPPPHPMEQTSSFFSGNDWASYPAENMSMYERNMNSFRSWPTLDSTWYSALQPSFSTESATSFVSHSGSNACDTSYLSRYPYSPPSLIPAEEAQINSTQTQKSQGCPFATLKAAPRVSIKDIVDQPFSEEQTAVAEPKLKRKADQISASDQPSQAETIGSTLVEKTYADAQVTDVLTPDIVPFATGMPSQSQLTPLPSIDSLLSYTHMDDQDERPRKKAKGEFMKLTMTALAGVAVGAVGAVAALVALPPDFFV